MIAWSSDDGMKAFEESHALCECGNKIFVYERKLLSSMMEMISYALENLLCNKHNSGTKFAVGATEIFDMLTHFRHYFVLCTLTPVLNMAIQIFCRVFAISHQPSNV